MSVNICPLCNKELSGGKCIYCDYIQTRSENMTYYKTTDLINIQYKANGSGINRVLQLIKNNGRKHKDK